MTIYRIDPEHLEPEILHRHIYPDLEQNYYWTDNWSPEFYAALARAGFISITHREPDLVALLPEIQKAYAVLDWPELRLSKSVHRHWRSGRPQAAGLHLSAAPEPEAVISGIRQAYGSRCWLEDRYAAVLRALASAGEAGIGGVRLLAVELRAGAGGALIGGELGLVTGLAYTSLTGFLNRNHPEANHAGTLQLASLAVALRQAGFAFWNLGHPYMQYKLDLGARILPRNEFLARWLPAVDGPVPSLPPALTPDGVGLAELLAPVFAKI